MWPSPNGAKSKRLHNIFVAVGSAIDALELSVTGGEPSASHSPVLMI